MARTTRTASLRWPTRSSSCCRSSRPAPPTVLIGVLANHWQQGMLDPLDHALPAATVIATTVPGSPNSLARRQARGPSLGRARAQSPTRTRPWTLALATARNVAGPARRVRLALPCRPRARPASRLERAAHSLTYDGLRRRQWRCPPTPNRASRHGRRCRCASARATFIWGERTYLMGIINVTPDSFSGDGLLSGGVSAAAGVEPSVAQARQMVEEGADLIDVGGQSTRPGPCAISRSRMSWRASCRSCATIRAALPDDADQHRHDAAGVAAGSASTPARTCSTTSGAWPPKRRCCASLARADCPSS